ncbi:hypothetical protein LTR91_017584 [Friedmanniomyces endolithicus]|uniref:Uncharacterized protein n=1 Tax=Friedmanniomyces endolithicus TaxID=329885 RepID=A0AAN6QK30_9PEZI|nr:hypothetical protein LTR94_016690 [Friedmanniomyces endolithicus]KAK0775110.1 hypothetical protein LTR59_014635 [Friedmanniomyces endolithicus]KAK0780669.1 hypothetical protein LTR38_014008 [Friedmanniomyces endolithicus]KAK0791194.1 hypothetical protein LTR75_011846 [Friedmanniomyces endolithicus]KAK0852871.1 hypothetical protein LTS02_012192 [Friedmanniomyces endolithicus]
MNGLSYDDVFTHAQARQIGFIEVPMDSARILLLPEVVLLRPNRTLPPFLYVEQLYVTYRRHFPPESAAWGFYLAGFEDVTDDLKAIATRRLTELGLSNQHTFYNLFVGPNRRDEVCACVQIMGPGITRFYIEQQLIEEIRLPRPLPDRHASQTTDHLSQKNFLLWLDGAGRPVQVFYGQQVPPNFTQLSGIYDVYRAGPQGRGVWLRFDFDDGIWVR